MSKLYIPTDNQPTKSKIYTIIKHGRNSDLEFTGSIERLAKDVFGYTLECGQSYEREKGNRKINRNPKTIKSLITNLNRAADNIAANGCSGSWYELA